MRLPARPEVQLVANRAAMLSGRPLAPWVELGGRPEQVEALATTKSPNLLILSPEPAGGYGRKG